MKDKTDDRLLISVEEAARRLSIGRSHAYELVARGTLRSLRIGRSRRIASSDLDAFIEALLQESVAVSSATTHPRQIRPVKPVHERSRRR